MKLTCVFILLLCLAASAAAQKAKLSSKITNLLAIQASAKGAVDDALQLLEDLLNQNANEQVKADDLNVTQQANGEAAIADYTTIRDNAQSELDAANEGLDDLNNQYADTQTRLAWITNRFATLDTQRTTYSEERCHSNFLFIKSIREHKDAIAIIEFLKQDLGRFATPASLSQIQEFGQKLSAYSHLFEQKQLQDFLQLGREQYEDNDQGQLALDNYDSSAAAANEDYVQHGGIGDALIAKLDALAQHLKNSLADLEANEIKANYDFAEWIVHADEEIQHLTSEQEQKNEFLGFLDVQISMQQTQVANASDALIQAQENLDAAVNQLIDLQNAYFALSARLADESSLLEEVIAIFKEKVLTMSETLQGRVDDYIPDQSFESSNIEDREIAGQVSEQLGNTAEQVEGETLLGGYYSGQQE